jgi:hypothetical protein
MTVLLAVAFCRTDPRPIQVSESMPAQYVDVLSHVNKWVILIDIRFLWRVWGRAWRLPWLIIWVQFVLFGILWFMAWAANTVKEG